MRQPFTPVAVPATDLDRARALHQQQRTRLKAFREIGDMFHDPAWELLLDLFIAAEEKREVSATSACLGARLPSTTGLRWLKKLEAMRLIRCRCDPVDQRRRIVELTETAADSMRRFLQVL